MKRLTYKDDDGYWAVAESGKYPNFGDLIDKLAAYEDLEEDGRLLRLPCKVWDPLYLIVGDNDNEIVELIAIEYRYGLDNRLRCRAKYADEPGYVDLFDFEFGRTVFLSREDAAAAVKGVGDE